MARQDKPRSSRTFGVQRLVTAAGQSISSLTTPNLPFVSLSLPPSTLAGPSVVNPVAGLSGVINITSPSPVEAAAESGFEKNEEPEVREDWEPLIKSLNTETRDSVLKSLRPEIDRALADPHGPHERILEGMVFAIRGLRGLECFVVAKSYVDLGLERLKSLENPERNLAAAKGGLLAERACLVIESPRFEEVQISKTAPKPKVVAKNLMDEAVQALIPLGRDCFPLLRAAVFSFAEACADNGALRLAVPFYEMGAQAAESQKGAKSADVVLMRSCLVDAYLDLGMRSEAKDELKLMQQAMPAKEHGEYATAYKIFQHRRVVIAVESKEYPQAAELAQEGIDFLEQDSSSLPTELGVMYSLLGDAQRGLEKFSEAGMAYEQALIYERRWNSSNPEDRLELSRKLALMGALMWREDLEQQALDEAERDFEKTGLSESQYMRELRFLRLQLAVRERRWDEVDSLTGLIEQQLRADPPPQLLHVEALSELAHELCGAGVDRSRHAAELLSRALELLGEDAFAYPDLALNLRLEAIWAVVGLESRDALDQAFREALEYCEGATQARGSLIEIEARLEYAAALAELDDEAAAEAELRTIGKLIVNFRDVPNAIRAEFFSQRASLSEDTAHSIKLAKSALTFGSERPRAPASKRVEFMRFLGLKYAARVEAGESPEGQETSDRETALKLLCKAERYDRLHVQDRSMVYGQTLEAILNLQVSTGAAQSERQRYQGYFKRFLDWRGAEEADDEEPEF